MAKSRNMINVLFTSNKVAIYIVPRYLKGQTYQDEKKISEGETCQENINQGVLDMSVTNHGNLEYKQYKF